MYVQYSRAVEGMVKPPVPDVHKHSKDPSFETVWASVGHLPEGVGDGGVGDGLGGRGAGVGTGLGGGTGVGAPEMTTPTG